MNRKIVILISLLCALLVFTDCHHRSSSGSRRTHSSKQKTTASSRNKKQSRKDKDDGKNDKVVTKTDTVFMIVPQNPENEYKGGNGEIVIPTNKMLKPVEHSDAWPTPPQIVFSRPSYTYTRDEYINNFEITGNMKDLIVACDYDNATVRNNATALVALSSGSFNLGQICDIFDFCYQNWSYVNDPITGEYFAKASETLKNGLNGDCDDFAILLCSMILSIGGEARINFAYSAAKGGHAFTEVNIGTTDRSQIQRYLMARYGLAEVWHMDEDGQWWLNLDWWGNYPGAKYYEYTSRTTFNIIRNTYVNY